MLLNELNPLKIDGQPLSTEHKKQLIKPSFRWTFSTDWGIQKGALFSFLQAMYSPLCFCPVRI